MSVSDAIGLITLRLGRVESYIKQLPPLDQIGANSSEEISENMRVVDEAVFTNIVARLEKIEQTPKNTNQSAGELKCEVDTLKNDITDVKNLLNSLQLFEMQTDQKFNFNQQQNSEEFENCQQDFECQLEDSEYESTEAIQ